MLRYATHATMHAAEGQQTRATSPFSLNPTGTLSRRYLAQFVSAVDNTACKAGVEGLTRSLARDFGPDRIRVNTLVPGWVMTERQVALWLDEVGERQITELQCLKEKVYPPDIARMVLFLGADDSRLCTGQDFIVDAGWV